MDPPAPPTSTRRSSSSATAADGGLRRHRRSARVRASGRGDRCRGPPARPDGLRGGRPHPVAPHEDQRGRGVAAARSGPRRLRLGARSTPPALRPRPRSRALASAAAGSSTTRARRPTSTRGAAPTPRCSGCCATSAKHASPSRPSAAVRASRRPRSWSRCGRPIHPRPPRAAADGGLERPALADDGHGRGDDDAGWRGRHPAHHAPGAARRDRSPAASGPSPRHAMAPGPALRRLPEHARRHRPDAPGDPACGVVAVPRGRYTPFDGAPPPRHAVRRRRALRATSPRRCAGSSTDWARDLRGDSAGAAGPTGRAPPCPSCRRRWRARATSPTASSG